MKIFRIVLTTSKRIVTKYVEMEERNNSELLAHAERIKEEESLGSFKFPPRFIEVDENHRATERPRAKAPVSKK